MSKVTANVKKYRYAEIDAVHKNDDGTIVVSGYASSGEIDSDGEVITPEAMAAAIPDYMKFGAVREMHGKSAAGTALEIEVQDDGRTSFSALIVDPVAVTKVEKGVYKGFSIGGKVKDRDELNKTIITGLNLIEVSLVDRPANPEALITMFKADGVDETEGQEIETEIEKSETASIVSETPAPGDDIKKSIWGVKDFAGVLQSMSYIVADAAYEAKHENDNSPVPEQLRDWLAQGVAIFQTMAAEELSEMMANLNAAFPPPVVAEAIQLSASTDIQKAGAKFSASHKADLASLHKMAADMCAKFDGLGYKDSSDDDETTEEKSDSDTDITKSQGDEISKAEELTKALEVARDDLTKAQAEIGDLNKSLNAAQEEIKKLKDQPAPPKAFALQVPISKGQDVGESKEENPHKPGTPEHSLWMMKAIHSGDLAKA